MIIDLRAIVRIAVVRYSCQRSLLCYFCVIMFVIMSSQKVKSRCQFLGFAKSVQKMNSINTTSGWSRMRRLQRVHQGNLVIGYKTVRRLYAISSIRCQFARDVQFFIRRVRGRGSSRDLSHRPDMSVIRWTVQSVDHQSVRLFVRPSVIKLGG